MSYMYNLVNKPCDKQSVLYYIIQRHAFTYSFSISLSYTQKNVGLEIEDLLQPLYWTGTDEQANPSLSRGINPTTSPRTIQQISINVCFCSLSLKSSRKSPFLSSFVRLFLVSLLLFLLLCLLLFFLPTDSFGKEKGSSSRFPPFPS